MRLRETEQGWIHDFLGAGADDVAEADLAVNANLKSCDGVVRTSDGTVFIADKDDRRIRRIGADGIITTAVGGGTMTTEGVAATAAQLSGPTELALDRDENLLICDGTKVKQVDSAGIITTIAGGVSPADGLGDGLQATAAKLAGCGSMTVGPDGKLSISGNTAKRVRVVDVDGIIRTFAGHRTIVNPYTQTVPWGVAALNFPLAEAEGLAVSPDNRVFVLEAL